MLSMDNINLEEIEKLIEQKEFKKAKMFLEEFKTSEDVELLKLLGLCNVNLELFEEGKNVFETVVKYSPDDATSWFYLANCYDSLDDSLHAKTAYLEVLKLRENYLDAYKNLGVIYLKNREEKACIELCKKALDFEQNDFRLYYLIGTAYMGQKQFDEGIEFLEKALELNPEHPQINNNLGTIYLARGEVDKAISRFEKATEINPNDSMSYYNLGAIHQMKNDHARACEFFKRAYEIEPADQYLVSLGLSQFKGGFLGDAVSTYKTLVENHPNKSNFKYNLACCYELMHRFKEAIEILEELVIVNPKAVLMLRKLSNLHIKINNLERAKEIYKRIMMQGSATPEIYHEYAMLCMETGDTDTAEKIFKKILELEPNSPYVHKDLGVIYLSKRLFDYAKDEFEKAMELAPDDEEIMFELANFYNATSDFSKADELYKKVLEISPNDAEYLTFCGKNKIDLNDMEGALVYLKKSLKLFENDNFTLFLTGKASFLSKDFEEAKRYLIAAFEANQSLETENLLALTYFNLGDFRQANQIFLNLLETSPNNTMVLLNSAKCYEQIGDKDLALKQLEKAVEIFPDLEEAHELIRRLS